MNRTLLATLTLLTGIAIAGPGSARDTTIPEATPVGPPQSCITRHRIAQSLVRSDSVIDFQMIDRKVYRVTLPQPCPGLGFQERFGYSVSIDQLCSSDIITVLYLEPQGPGARCGLAPFQQVTLAPRQKRPR
ncbi:MULTISPECIES: hypothetical protein [Sphingomonas]|uniref:hypothetical protein n=1 Tax=Sphingomonas TaxID=13687 RepID=UPI000832BDE9|nr:hypothetical protein [Sphingomonas sp. CCH10-B3]